MNHLTIDDDKALLSPDTTVTAPQIRDAVPGVSWDGNRRQWIVPLTRRSVLALRRYLTGKEVTVDSAARARLAAIADSEPVPDITVEGERIVFRFEFHNKYQAFVLALGATNRQDGSWSLPLDNADQVIRALEVSSEIDLIASPDLFNVKMEPIPGFDGTVGSLRFVDISVLKVIRREIQSAKSRKKATKSLEERFKDMGISTLFDLIHTYPIRYIDRSNPVLIKDLKEGEDGAVVGKIIDIQPYDRSKRMTKVIIADSANNRISVTFFSQPWVNKRFRAGQEVLLSGEFGYWRPAGRGPVPQMNNAKMDALIATADNAVIPIYPQSEKLVITTYDITRAVKELLSRIEKFEDEMPVGVALNDSDLLDFDTAIRYMHNPPDLKSADAARNRLLRDELTLLQAHIFARKEDHVARQGIQHPVLEDGLAAKFINSLPYTLTDDQAAVLDAIKLDLAAPRPMNRLLQGDVGSGKTTVAHWLTLCAVDAGRQSALVAPTEILAEQLHQGLAEAVEPLGVNVAFLGGKTTAKDRRSILEGLSNGDIQVVVGTHALLTDQVQFNDLSIVCIDEQHRFGTLQRTALLDRRADNKLPDLLVMSATPIPRTGAMVLYGELDMSVIKHLPPGRTPIATEWIRQDAESALADKDFPAWQIIREQIAQGRQAYVVASLVEDNEKVAAASTEYAYDALGAGPLYGLRLGMVHGRQPRKEREAIMSQFAAGEIDVLVSTTVIEVGVNVPNATTMVVLDAGRYGLAQLHQIRGRVGRGKWESRCFLVGDTRTPTGQARMEALVDSTDGFYLAEKDLEIRGEGALFGTRQSGASDLRITSLSRDYELLLKAREDIEYLREQAPQRYYRMVSLSRQYYEGKEIAS